MEHPHHSQAGTRSSAVRGVRVRYDRMLALLVATGVTVFALLAGVGSLGPVTAEGGIAGDQGVRTTAASYHDQERSIAPSTAPSTAPGAVPSAAGTSSPTASTPGVRPASEVSADPDGSHSDMAVPSASGAGRRIVFDMSDQRVWLVDDADHVERTYLVSGSVTDNLRPGSYRVYSRSLHAVGVEDSGTMQYFVRFTRGQHAAIGFHDIPIDDGRLVQTAAQLGSPQSHGCIRQTRADAIRLWDFAPTGTKVSVVA